MKTAFVVALCVLMISLGIAQAPDVQPKQSNFNTVASESPNPHGRLSLSIPLVNLASRGGNSYDFSLGYQSGIRFHDKGSPMGLGWSFPIFHVTRRVRGVPDEADFYKFRKYGPTFPERFFRLGRFGWLDYSDYATRTGWSVTSKTFHGFVDESSQVLGDFANPGIQEVEDVYELASPFGSGRLVYHHFEVLNAQIPDTTTTDDFDFSGGLRMYERGRKRLTTSTKASPPHYKIYFFLESYEAVRAIYHIEKLDGWRYAPGSPYSFESRKAGTKSKTWWEIIDPYGNRYTFGKTSDSYTEVSGVPYLKETWKQSGGGYTTATKEVLDLALTSIWDIVSSTWYLNKIDQVAFPSDSITFVYSKDSKFYDRYNGDFYNYHPADTTVTPVLMSIGKGVKGWTMYAYLARVETPSQVLELDSGYAKPDQDMATVKFYRYLRKAYLKSKINNRYTEMFEFQYRNHHWKNPFDSLEATNATAPYKILLSSVRKIAVDGPGINLLTVVDSTIPPHNFEYLKFQPGKEDFWGFDHGNNAYDPGEDCWPSYVPEAGYFYFEGNSFYRGLKDQTGGLPNLSYNNGNPQSANWSLKSVIYPTGAKKVYHYAPAGDIMTAECLPPQTTPPFMIKNITTTDSSGLVKRKGLTTYPDTISTAITMYNTIGGPPKIVRILTIDAQGDSVYTNFEYRNSRALTVPYAYLAADDGTPKPISIFSRYTPYPDVVRWTSVPTYAPDTMFFMRTRSDGTTVQDTAVGAYVVDNGEIQNGTPQVASGLIFYGDPESPILTANYTAAFYGTEMAHHTPFNLIHYDTVLTWQTKVIDSTQSPKTSSEAAIAGITLLAYKRFLITGRHERPVELVSGAQYENNTAIQSGNFVSRTVYNKGAVTPSKEPIAFASRNTGSISTAHFASRFMDEYGVPSGGVNMQYTESSTSPLRLLSDTTTIDNVTTITTYSYRDVIDQSNPKMIGFVPYGPTPAAIEILNNPTNLPNEITVLAGSQVLKKTVNTYHAEYNGDFYTHSLAPVDTMLVKNSSSQTVYSEVETRGPSVGSQTFPSNVLKTRVVGGITKLTIDKYDDYGRQLEIKDGNSSLVKLFYGDNTTPFSNTATGLASSVLTGIQRAVGTAESTPYTGDDHWKTLKYDSKGNVTEIINENNKSQYFSYDGHNRLGTHSASVSGSTPELTTYAYSYSRKWGNSYQYDASDPNVIETAAYAQSVSRVGLAGYWRLEGNRVNEMNGDTLYIVSAPAVRGYVGTGLSFNGTTSRYAYDTIISPYQAAQPTIEAWIKRSATGAMTIASVNVAGAWQDGRGFYIDVDANNKARLVVGNASGSWKVATGATTLSTNTWYHITGVYDGIYVRIYVNGVQDGATNVGAITISYTSIANRGPNPSTFYIGIQHNSNNTAPTYTADLAYPFNGIIDEVRIYTRALSATEIASHYSADVRTIYADGLGRQRQTQNRLGGDDIIAAQTYDNAGRPHKSYKPYQVTLGSSAHWYDANFRANDSTYYLNDLGYTYAEMRYQENPLGRIDSIGNPGNSWRFGLGHEVRYTYTADASSQRRIQRQVDEDGKRVDKYFDRFGNVVRSVVDSTGMPLATTYEYNVMNNMTKSIAPNTLTTTYTYNTLQQLTQKVSPDAGTWSYIYDQSGNLRFTTDGKGQYIYQKYDSLNRVTEVGRYTGVGSDINQTNANNRTFPTSSYVLEKMFVYDNTSSDPLATGQQNLKGRLSFAHSYDSYGGTGLFWTTFYSYDDLGRVEFVVHKQGTKAWKITYTYDMQGRATKKAFADSYNGYNLYAYNEYDQTGRIAKVSTNSVDNSGTATKEAEYTYSATGKVKQLKLGATPAQTVDYTYNERDWLAKINDMSNPGADRFAETVSYNTGSVSGTALYNGNITSTEYYNPTLGKLAYSYTYDPTNRMTTAQTWLNSGSWYQTNNFKLGTVTYDSAGNIRTMQRYGSAGTLMDNLTYNYVANTNRLSYISDAVASGTYSVDIDNQSSGNYAYDGNGNATQDLQKGFTTIGYNIRNLVASVYDSYLTSTYSYYYDAADQRAYVVAQNNDKYYINSADGRTEAVVAASNPGIITHNIWGNDLVGQVNRNVSTLNRYYYLKDHLGSIRTTVDASNTVVGYDDYDPWGMILEGRSLVSNADARYRFIGAERDVETGFYATGRRWLDPKMGRFGATDRFDFLFPSISSYSYGLNNPIFFTDVSGDSAVPYRPPLSEYPKDSDWPIPMAGFTIYPDEPSGNDLIRKDDRGKRKTEQNTLILDISFGSGGGLLGQGFGANTGFAIDLFGGNTKAYINKGFVFGFGGGWGLTVAFKYSNLNSYSDYKVPGGLGGPGMFDTQSASAVAMGRYGLIGATVDLQSVGAGVSFGPGAGAYGYFSKQQVVSPELPWSVWLTHVWPMLR